MFLKNKTLKENIQYSDLLEDRRVIGKHLKKSQKEIVQLKNDKENEIKSRLFAEKSATTNKGIEN